MLKRKGQNMKYALEQDTVVITEKILDEDVDLLKQIIDDQKHKLIAKYIIKTQHNIPLRVVFALLRYQNYYKNIELYVCTNNFIYFREAGLVDLLNIKLLQQ